MSAESTPGPNQERLAFLGTLAGGLAHEIKNPLSTMTITLGLLREDLETARGDPERSLRRVKVLEREVTRLEEILAHFLQFAGRLRLERRPTDLNRVVSEVLDFITPAAHKKKIELRHHLSNGLPPLLLDRDRVKQALLNLVLNALEAMPGRGEVLVQTSVQGGAVRVDVTDTGPGIPPDVLPRIFEAYFSSKKTGTGLGLPIARRIVEEHGGIVEVFTEVGKGTRFTLWFPVPPPGPPTPAPPNPVPPNPVPPRRKGNP
jgi:two-component system sensor histidine kinase HydH